MRKMKKKMKMKIFFKRKFQFVLNYKFNFLQTEKIEVILMFW